MCFDWLMILFHFNSIVAWAFFITFPSLTPINHATLNMILFMLSTCKYKKKSSIIVMKSVIAIIME